QLFVRFHDRLVRFRNRHDVLLLLACVSLYNEPHERRFHCCDCGGRDGLRERSAPENVSLVGANPWSNAGGVLCRAATSPATPTSRSARPSTSRTAIATAAFPRRRRSGAHGRPST